MRPPRRVGRRRVKRGRSIGKTCKSCGQDRWFRQKDKRSKKGWTPVCLPCVRARDRARPTNLRVSPEYRLWYAARSRAKQKGLDFSITPDQIVIPARCPALDVPLSQGDMTTAPSLDRLDSSRGYTPDNICVISHRANTIKLNASAEELERIAAWLRKETA